MPNYYLNPVDANRGVFLWPALLGTALAVAAVLSGYNAPTDYNRLAALLQKSGDTYTAKFPHEPRPLLAEYDFLPLPQEVIHGIAAVSFLLGYGLGLLAVMLVRPRGLGDDVNIGLAAGVVTISVMWMCGVMQGLFLATAVAPVHEDLRLLSKGSFPSVAATPAQDSPTEYLLRKYPDLQAAPP